MDIKNILEENEDLREKLFIRGFLITTCKSVKSDQFPFYSLWNRKTIDAFQFWMHPLTGFHYVEKDGITSFVLGHCYNPFTMEVSEDACLRRIMDHYGKVDFYDYLDEITGVFVIGFISNGVIEFLVDPSGMQSACYGYVNNEFYLSSHAQLIGDLCNLKMTDICKEIVAYKWYNRVMGCYLPADMEPFDELRRIVPNINYRADISNSIVAHKRFYPIRDLSECRDEKEYQQVIEKAANILKNNLILIAQKWDNPGISLSGGIDSNTVFAAANGVYDKLHAFSFYSAKKEIPDCEAAKKTVDRFNVKWNYYDIPEGTESLDRFEEHKEIIAHNNAYIAPRSNNETRKRVYLAEYGKETVEIKGWTSETIRCYWYKHYGRKSFPKLSPKLYRNLYKIFITNRKLAHKIDRLFDEYIREFEYESIPAQYPPADMHYNEVTWGSWGGMNISEMKYYADTVIPYNNRRFLDLLFKVSLDKRISDQHHLDMKRYLNKELADMNIRVVNMAETDFRAFCLNCIFTMNCLLP